MLRALAFILAAASLSLAACSKGYAVRPLPRVVKDSVGQPVSSLQSVFGAPRKIDAAPTKLVYVWYVAQSPPGAPPGFHGCEIEATVDPRSQIVLGVSESNIGWTKCSEINRRVRLASQ